MFVALREITVTEGNADKVVEQFSSPSVIEEQDGFVDLSVMKKKKKRADKEETVVVMIRWESEDHWKKWETSEAHLAAHRENRGKPQPEYIISQDGGRYNVEAVKKPAE